MTYIYSHSSIYNNMKIIFLAPVTLIIIFITQCVNTNSIKSSKDYALYNDDGELLRPKDYRSWIFAGTVTTPKLLDSTALFPDFQNVYIDPVSFDFWKENGYFREGTVMVKELLWATKQRTLPIGQGFVQGDAYDIAVTVKDTLRFPDVPGGWEYFHFGEDEGGNYKESTVVVGKSLGCIACHSRSEAGYGPFPELYAPLRDAKKFGKDSPENLKNRGSLPSGKLDHLVD